MFGGMTTAAQLMVKVGADVSEAQSKLAGVSSSFKNLGGQAMALGGKMTLGITGPLVAAGAVVTRFASDLEESANKVNVVFGEQATAMQAWAESAATSFGMSRQQALEAAGTFGNLFTAMGVAGQESADMSQSLIELAADLASFNNIDPAEALLKLRAGLVGEAEPLRTLGVQLSAAAVEAKALEMGLAGTAKELTEADKVSARYALIMEQTATAQGDFARTSDGLANQMRTVKAQFADAGAQLGTVLLPYVTQFVGWIGNLISYFTNLDPQMQTWIVAIGAVVAAIGPAITIIGVLATALGALLSPIGLVVAAVAGLVIAWQTNFMGIRDAIQPAIDSFLSLIEVIGWGIEDGWSVAEWIEVLSSKFPLLGEAIGIVIGAFTLAKDALLLMWTDWQSVFTQIWSLVSSVFWQIAEIVQTVLWIVIGSIQEHAVALQEQFVQAYTTAKAIVEGVLTAIAAIVQSVLGVVKAFLAAHGTEIQAVLGQAWEQIGRIINLALEVIQATVIPIFQGIAQFISEHGTEIQTILTAAWEIIKNVIQGALTLIEGILRATMAILKGDWQGAWDIIKNTVATVWENIKNILNAATSAMVTAVGVSLTTIYNWFVEKFNGIKSYLQGISLADIGRGMIQGLVDGIRSMAGALVSAAQGVVQSAIDAARNLLGMHSPSKVFRRMGQDTIQGFIDGVVSMASAAAAATQSTLSASVLAALETLGGVANALGQIMAAMQGLASYGGAEDLHERLKTLASDINMVVEELRMLPLTGGGMAGTATMMKPLAEIFSGLGTVVDALEKVGSLNFSAANITLFVQSLKTTMPLLVNALIEMAQQIEVDGLLAAQVFSQAVGEVMGIIGAAVEGITAAMTFVLPETDGTDDLLEALRRFVARLETMALAMDYQAFDAAVRFAAAAGAIGGNIKNAVAGLLAAMAYQAPEVDNSAALFEALRRFVARLQTMALMMDYQAFDAAETFATAVGRVAAGIGKGLDLLLDLVGYIGPTEDEINDFMRDLQFLFERMARWATLVMLPIMETISEDMADMMAALMAALSEAIETLTDLVDYVSPGQEAVEAFMRDMDDLVRRFVAWAIGTRSGPIMLLDVPPALMDAFTAAMDALATAIGTLTALVDYVSPGEAAIAAFMTDMDDLVRRFVLWAIGSRSGPIMLLDVPPALMDAFTAAMEGISGAIGVLNALVGYVSPGEAAITAFMGDMESMFRRFANWASTQFSDVALDVVAAVGDAIGAVFDGLGAAATTLQAITWYVGPTSETIDRFMDDMEEVMIRLRNWALANFTPASLAFLETFGNMAQVLFTAVGQALEVMTGIADYTVSGSDFDLALQRFNDNLFTMLTSWRTWIVTIMEPETTALVSQFATVLGGIVAGFRDALNLLMDIENANLPTADELAAFLLAIVTLFDGVIDSFGLVRQAVLDQAIELWIAFDTLYSMLGTNSWNRGAYVASMFMGGLLLGMTNANNQNAVLDAMNALALALKDVLMEAWGIASPSKVAERIGKNFVAGLANGLADLQGIPGMIEDAVGLTMNNNVRLTPAPQRAYLTVNFQGAYQSGMSPEEEARISRVMVMELRRQGVVLVTR